MSKEALSTKNNLAQNPLSIIFLGGLEEIGMNSLMIRWKDHGLIIDCGIGFPDPLYNLGVDLAHADFSPLNDPNLVIHGILLTHGHEDHIGAIPYLLQTIQSPIFGTPITLSLVDIRLQQHGISEDLIAVSPKKTYRLGPFEIKWISTHHSIPGSCALSIQTPHGHIVHSGDFKLTSDSPTLRGDPFEIFRHLGEKGVDILLCESTNVHDTTPSKNEASLHHEFESIIKSAPGRVFFVTFASHIERLKMITQIAKTLGRKIAIEGSSLKRYLHVAQEHGYLSLHPVDLLDIKSLRSTSPQSILLLTTGSQAEVHAAMTRIATGRHPSLQIKEDDTVIWSAKWIPGNQRSVAHIVNQIVQKGARVFSPPFDHVHVSGHANRSELQLLHKLVGPKYIVPIHGEQRFLQEHRRLALSSGFSSEQIFVCRNGDQLTLIDQTLSRSDPKQISKIFIDHSGGPKVSLFQQKERRLIGKNGVLIFQLLLNENQSLILPPRLDAKGVPCQQEALFDDWPQFLQKTFFDTPTTIREQKKELQRHLKKKLGKYIFRQTGLQPQIIPLILELNLKNSISETT